MVRTRTTPKRFESQVHISYSQVRTYLTCPQRFEFQYVRGMPWEFIPDYLPFGRSIHEAVTVFYRTMKETGQMVPSYELIDHFKESWDRESQGNIRFKENQNRDSLREKGVRMLKVSYQNVSPREEKRLNRLENNQNLVPRSKLPPETLQQKPPLHFRLSKPSAEYIFELHERGVSAAIKTHAPS